MLRTVAQTSVKGDNLVSTMDFVLEKFHLAVHKEIKYTDYRSAFSELQC